MARVKDIVVKDLVNLWGVQGGPNPQRTDLWQVDLSEAITGINNATRVTVAQSSKFIPPELLAAGPQYSQLLNQSLARRTTLPDLPRYYHASVTLPELKIKAEPVRRDSRSYNMPSWDEPLDSIRMTFVMDDASSADASHSAIYTLLDTWRELVRAGRGAVGMESTFMLNANYRIDYAFPVYVYLLRGLKQSDLSVAVRPSQPVFAPIFSESLQATFEGGSAPVRQSTQSKTVVPFGQTFNQKNAQLNVSGIFHLENTWLAGFKISELAYERSGVLTIEATLYADNILQVRPAP